MAPSRATTLSRARGETVARFLDVLSAAWVIAPIGMSGDGEVDYEHLELIDMRLDIGTPGRRAHTVPVGSRVRPALFFDRPPGTTPASCLTAPRCSWPRLTVGGMWDARCSDINRLTAYLVANSEFPAGAVEVKQFNKGQSNPTYLLTASDGHRYAPPPHTKQSLLRTAAI